MLPKCNGGTGIGQTFPFQKGERKKKSDKAKANSKSNGANSITEYQTIPLWPDVLPSGLTEAAREILPQDFARQSLGPQGSEKTYPSGDSLTGPLGSHGHSPHCIAAHWNHKWQRNKLRNRAAMWSCTRRCAPDRAGWGPTNTSNSSFEAPLSMGSLYSGSCVSVATLRLSESPWWWWGLFSYCLEK